ncbi:MAG TPA: CoA-binding protein [Candidatus Bilamarchaeum sp.]|nr:CoA-binding protein [Candidatus Bilamarchaeum sp.]
MDASGILKEARTVAVVGLSDKPERPSYDVALYLQNHGYRVIPVNPMIKEWRGLKSYASLSDIPKSEKIDVVDIFRKSEDVPPIVDEAIRIGARAVWMQLGIVNEGAAGKAREAGLEVVMDKCMKIEHGRMHAPDI